MNSAEASGVDEKGFATPKDTGWRSIASGIPQSIPSILSVLAALAAAATFIGYDASRSISNMQHRLQLMAALTAEQIEPANIERPGALILPTDVLPGLEHTVTTRAGGLAVSTLPASARPEAYLEASADIPGNLGTVTLFLPRLVMLENLALRYGPLLLALSVAVGAFGWARRRPPATGTASQTGAPAIEAVPYGVAHWHEDGRLICANGAFARLLRLGDQVLVPGTDYGTVSRTINGKITVRPVLDAARQRVIEVERDDGSVLMLDERPCRSGGGFVTIVTDVTDRKAADRLLSRIREDQRQLARRYHEEKIRAEASSRAKTSFLAHLSHDIRTPLNHIIGFADLIRMETFGPLGDPKYRTYVEDIRKAGEQLLSSFAEILEFAELEGGRKTLKSAPVAVGDLLSGSAARFAARAQRAGIRLHVAPGAMGHLLADRHYLDRMLANLIDNAIRFTRKGGEIRLAAWAAEDGVVLEVTDSGIGMSAAQMEKLFQPFVLSDAAFTRSHNGIGLGIAIARAIAEQSGGRLAIDSLEGVGTTVAISLPLAPINDLSLTPVAEIEQARAA